MANQKPKTFGEQLRASRVEKRVFMRDLAAHLGITVSYLSDVELGKRRPFGPERIRAIAKFLEINPEDLMGLSMKHWHELWRNS